MFNLPTATDTRKQLPKKAIYAKFDLKPSQRESFDGDVARIDIVAVVSPATVPALRAGNDVQEFYVLAVQMKHRKYDTRNITLLTRLIPRKMVLALQYAGQTQFAIHHTKLITSPWQSTEDATLPLSGLNLDSVWEGIVQSIGHIEVELGNTLAEQIAHNDQQAKLLAQIATLERKMATEKQPRRKREYFEQIARLKRLTHNS